MFLGKSPELGCAWGHWQRIISIPGIGAVSRRDPPGSSAELCAAPEKERFVVCPWVALVHSPQGLGQEEFILKHLPSTFQQVFYEIFLLNGSMWMSGAL